jgi:DNA-binding CsgD family transcriptional regulator
MLAIDDSAPGRFRMLESLREFGCEQLDAAGETEAVHELLLGWLAGRSVRLLASRARAQDFEQLSWDLRALETYRYAATVAGRSADPRHPVLATATALLLKEMGRLTEARELAGQVLVQPGLAPRDRVWALTCLTSTLGLCGEHPAALAHAEEAYEIAVSAEDPDLIFHARAYVLCALGDDEPARSTELLRLQLALVEDLGDPDRLADPLNEVAWDQLVSGAIADAQETADRLLALRAGNAGAGELHTCGAIALANGRPHAAEDLFTLGLLRAVGGRTVLYVIEGLAMTALAQGELRRALQILAGAAAQRVRLHLPTAGWWAVQLGAAIPRARAQLPAAEADAAEAEGTALTLEELTALARDGQAPGPRLEVTPLTPRESSIARLVAAGHTTRQIAARLGMGARSVDGAVARARAKLGLSSRSQLAVWAAEHL